MRRLPVFDIAFIRICLGFRISIFEFSSSHSALHRSKMTPYTPRQRLHGTPAKNTILDWLDRVDHRAVDLAEGVLRHGAERHARARPIRKVEVPDHRCTPLDCGRMAYRPDSRVGLHPLVACLP